MTRVLFSAWGLTITWGLLLAVLATVQWLVFATLSAASRKVSPAKGLRKPERNLLFSTAGFLLLWLAALDVGTVFAGRTPAPRVEAAVAAPKARGSCASLTVGMTGKEVTARMGQADEVRNDEETRGPGAALWIYRDSRCVVHLYDGKVEFID